MPDSAASLRVLARPAFSNRGSNPYNSRLYSGLSARGVRIDEYHPLRGLLGCYDVFHVHWPESTFNASLVEAIATTETLLRATDRLRRRGAKVLWTAHNLQAHERRFPARERAFWQAFVPRLDAVIALSETGLAAARARFPELGDRPGFVVPHHHYRGEHPDDVDRVQARARLGLDSDRRVVLFFGRVLEYKNVPALVRLVRALRRATGYGDVTLLVAGAPRDGGVERRVREAAAGDPATVLHLEFVPKERVQLYFRAADLVVLPYREIFNSGSAVLALGFDRSVVLPRHGAGGELVQSVGEGWVHVYDELDPAFLARALAASAELPERTDGAHLAALDPSTAVDRTLAAYRTVVYGRAASGAGIPGGAHARLAS